MKDDNKTSKEAQSIGSALRELRKGRELSLATVASRAGLTKGFLSQVERGAKDPSISTLVRLARALDVPISSFFKDATPDHGRFSLVRSDERKPLARQGTLHGYRYEAIAYRRHVKRMEPFVAHLPQKPPSERFRHDGEEMIFVLDGRVGTYIDDDYFELDEGDCIYFDASVPHNSFSLGDSPAVVLIVVSPD